MSRDGLCHRSSPELGTVAALVIAWGRTVQLAQAVSGGAGMGGMRLLQSLHFKLHYLVAVIVDDLGRDLAGSRLGEGARVGGVERGPGIPVDIGLEGRLEPLVWIVAVDGLAMTPPRRRHPRRWYRLRRW